MAGIGFGTNYDVFAGNGLGPQTRIINLAKSNMTQAELDAAIQYLSHTDVAGTNDAHTIAGISVLTESGVFTGGTTDAVQVAIQGTGVATMASNFGTGSTGITATLVATFVD
mgnify:FL=1|jgi:indole-3-glycerol phosphate synthase|tara:strand:- start:4927 stop:5262 length:336 start_codon:yes stop_codon:yes gene_type:complete